MILVFCIAVMYLTATYLDIAHQIYLMQLSIAKCFIKYIENMQLPIATNFIKCIENRSVLDIV